MPIYDVRRQEIHVSVVRVAAADAIDAKGRVADGHGDEIELQYLETVSPDEWATPEPVAREEIVTAVEDLAQELVASGQISGFKEIFGDDMGVDIPSLSDERLAEIFEEYILED